MIALTFFTPPPLSLNHMYRPGRRGQRILTDAAVAYKAAVGYAAKEAAATWGFGLCPDGYQFTLRIWFADKRRADLDNAVKLTLDATAAALGFDDRFVNRLVIERAGIDRANPRGMVMLEEWTE